MSAGRAHALGAGAARPVALADFMASAAVAGSSRLFLADGPGPPATFVCGAYTFEGDLCRELLASLPAVVHVRPEPGGRLRAALDRLAREIQADVPGRQAILDRLLDVVLVHVLIEHFGGAGDPAPPWFRALEDPEVGRALVLMHAEPARGWSVAQLAGEVGLSRSAFARRFAEVMGTPPLQELTAWRMALAREELRDRAVPLAVIARDVGYASEYAFAAAFKRAHGEAARPLASRRRRGGCLSVRPRRPARRRPGPPSRRSPRDPPAAWRPRAAHGSSNSTRHLPSSRLHQRQPRAERAPRAALEAGDRACAVRPVAISSRATAAGSVLPALLFQITNPQPGSSRDQHE